MFRRLSIYFSVCVGVFHRVSIYIGVCPYILAYVHIFSMCLSMYFSDCTYIPSLYIRIFQWVCWYIPACICPYIYSSAHRYISVSGLYFSVLCLSVRFSECVRISPTTRRHIAKDRNPSVAARHCPSLQASVSSPTTLISLSLMRSPEATLK